MFESLNNYMQKPNSNAEQMSLFGVACISQWKVAQIGLNRNFGNHTNFMESCIMNETLNMYSFTL